jgi:hypothetical protein
VVIGIRRRREDAAREVLSERETAWQQIQRENAEMAARLARHQAALDAEIREMQARVSLDTERRVRMIDFQRHAEKVSLLRAQRLTLVEEEVKIAAREKDSRQQVETARAQWLSLRLRREQLEALPISAFETNRIKNEDCDEYDNDA